MEKHAINNIMWIKEVSNITKLEIAKLILKHKNVIEQLYTWTNMYYDVRLTADTINHMKILQEKRTLGWKHLNELVSGEGW